MNSKELREKRAKLFARIKELRDKMNAEGYEPAAEDEANWQQLNQDYDALTLQIQRAERVETLENEQTEVAGGIKPGQEDRTPSPEEPEGMDGGPTEEDRALALQGWMRVQEGYDVDERHELAARRAGVRLGARFLDVQILATKELRALSAKIGEAGAFTIPDSFVNNFERALLAFGGVRQAAEIMRTAGGGDMPWPTADDTSNKGALLAESGAAGEQDITFAQTIWRAHKYTSKMIKVPVELLEDSAFDLANRIGEMLGERIGRITADHFTTGDGNGKPKGIVTASALGKTSASATAITADELIDLFHAVDAAYRVAPGCGWMFHDLILAAIRKLKGSDNNYLWQPGLRAGEPDVLLAKPYFINQSMDSTLDASSKVVLFGDLRKYKVRDVATIRLRRLMERYADADQEGFVAFSRHDGNLLDAGTNPVKHLITKSS